MADFGASAPPPPCSGSTGSRNRGGNDLPQISGRSGGPSSASPDLPRGGGGSRRMLGRPTPTHRLAGGARRRPQPHRRRRGQDGARRGSILGGGPRHL